MLDSTGLDRLPRKESGVEWAYFVGRGRAAGTSVALTVAKMVPGGGHGGEQLTCAGHGCSIVPLL